MDHNSKFSSTQELANAADWAVQNIPGFPTLAEFQKNPDAYRSSSEALFESIDQSSFVHKKAVIKQVYYWKDQYRCESLEKLQRIIKEEGYSESDVEMRPMLRSATGTNQDTIESCVEVWPKNDIRAMGGVVAND